MTHATGTAECEAARALLARRPDPSPRATLGADPGDDTQDVVAQCRDRHLTLQVAQTTTGRRRAIDRRTTRHAGSAISHRSRTRVAESVGWTTPVGGGRTRRAGGRVLVRTQAWADLTTAADNLVRMVTWVPSAA